MRTKKQSHAPSSWSPFPVSACQPKHCLIQKHREEDSANQLKDWELCLRSAEKGGGWRAQQSVLLFESSAMSASEKAYSVLWGCVLWNLNQTVCVLLKQRLELIRSLSGTWINGSTWFCGYIGQAGSEAALQPSATSEAHNMWPLSQHGWDWLLFTEECLCSTTEKWGNAYLMWNSLN